MALACQHHVSDSPHDTYEEAGALHERLVAYVHSLAHGGRRGVWGEHSYARARGVRAPARVRTLLAPEPPRAPAATLHPARLDPEPPEPPRDPAAPADPDTDSDADDDRGDDDWEPRAVALAPTPAHARLVAAAADVLRRARLDRLVHRSAVARRESVVAGARRLRLALAPPAAPPAAPAWLHATLRPLLPPRARRRYDALLAELRRAAPALAARAEGAPAPRPAGGGRARRVGPESSPWLVWVGSGCGETDARWERALGALVHTRRVRAAGAGAGGGGGEAAGAWCAGAAAGARAALTDALAEAGSRSVILGGCGAGASVALLLARGAGGCGGAGGVRGCVLVAPPLLTAEGARDGADDALADLRLPLLLVVGAAAADSSRALANRVCERRCTERRLLEVRCADAALRVCGRVRARRRLPQYALDAALAEEVARWAIETAEREEPPEPEPDPPRHRHHGGLDAVASDGGGPGAGGTGAGGPGPGRAAPGADAMETDEEYAHLPPAAPPHAASSRAAEVSGEGGGGGGGAAGRVVSRVRGGTPLTLAPPVRRAGAAPGAGAGAALGAADILQLPIVFADDSAEAAGAPLTVTSGKRARGGGAAGGAGGGGGGGGGAEVKFTRVLLARGGGAGAGGGAPPRRLLLRRPLARAQRP